MFNIQIYTALSLADGKTMLFLLCLLFTNTDACDWVHFIADDYLDSMN